MEGIQESYKWLTLRLEPTKEQEVNLWKHVNHTRAVKNMTVERCYELLDNGEKIKGQTIDKEMTQKLKLDEYKWLKEISRSTVKKAIQTVDDTFRRYLKKEIKKPKFYSKATAKKTFLVRNDADKFRRKENAYRVEKLGFIKVSYKTLNNHLDLIKRVEEAGRFTLPTIKHDGKYWYLLMLYRDDLFGDNQPAKLEDLTIGIDLGITPLATCSDGKVYDNINKTKKIKDIEKRLKRKQRKVSRKYEMNKTPEGFKKTNNIIKLEKEIKLLYRRMTNIRDNYIDNMTKEIVEQNPKRVIIEDLKVSYLRKNRYLSKSVNEAKWNGIRRKLEYKCLDRGIRLVVANQYYPSTQICSHCESRKEKKDKLTLRDRVYKCGCGNVMDRDLNAAINLKFYEESKWLKAESKK